MKEPNKVGICNSTCLSQDRKQKPVVCTEHKICMWPSINFAVLEQTKQLVAPCCFQSQSRTCSSWKVVGTVHYKQYAVEMVCKISGDCLLMHEYHNAEQQ